MGISMENRRFPPFEIGDFVRNINDILIIQKKNVGIGYLPLHYYEVYYICSILRKFNLRSFEYETVPSAAG